MRCGKCKQRSCVGGGHPSAQRMLRALVNNERINGLGVFSNVKRGTILAGYIDGQNCTFRVEDMPVGPRSVNNNKDRASLAAIVHRYAFPKACSQVKIKVMVEV